MRWSESVRVGRQAVLLHRAMSSPSTLGHAAQADTTKAASGGPSSAEPKRFHVNPELSLKSKTLTEIARAYSLLYLCSFPSLVNNADALIKFGEKTVGGPFTWSVLKHTFAAQYTGGETVKQLEPMIRGMNAAHIGAILDYVAEADLTESQQEFVAGEPDAEVPVATIAEPTLVDELPQPHVFNQGMMDRREDAMAVTHIYKNDQQCLENMEISKTAIRHAAMQVEAGITPFAATKITALMKPEALLSVSRVLHLLLHTFPVDAIPTFPLADIPDPVPGDAPPVWPVSSVAELEQRLRETFPLLRNSEKRMQKILDAVDPDRDGLLTYACWYTACKTLWCDEEVIKSFGWDPIPEDDRVQVKQGIALASELAELASELGVRLMVDAEQTYFQTAIDMIVMQLQTKYNTETPVVFNTIQCYLKDARPRLQIELEAHRRLGVKSGFKLVRGAYILQERQRSEEMEYPDPTCDDIAMTHANYDTCVLDAIRQVPTGAAVMVASHNQKSIETAVNAIARMGLGPNDGVYFGQLLGMGDHLTTAIAAHGCRPYKYVPYGPIDKCVAYLTRRVQENSTLLAGEPIIAERRMLRGELFKRLTFRS